MAADLYWQEVDALRAELSLQNASEALRTRVGDVAEPYRVLLRQVRDRLDRTRDWAAGIMAGKISRSSFRHLYNCRANLGAIAVMLRFLDRNRV